MAMRFTALPHLGVVLHQIFVLEPHLTADDLRGGRQHAQAQRQHALPDLITDDAGFRQR
jgi:hypothetical protein